MALHIPDSYQYPEPSIAPLSARVMGTMVYALVFLLAVMLISDEAMSPGSAKFIFVIGAIGVWRYSWSMTHLMRALYYRGVAFPALRTQVDTIVAVKKIPHFYIMVTSYRMDPSVTARVYRAMIDEIKRYGTPTTVFAAVTDEADESLIEDIFYSLNPPDFITLHLFQQDGTGKRTALAESSTYRLHSAFYCLGARQCHMTRMIIPIYHQT